MAVAVGAGDLEGQATSEGNTGIAYHSRADRDGSIDDYQAALHHFEQSATLNEHLGRRINQALFASNLGQVHLRLGQDDATRRAIREGLTLAHQSGATETVLFCVLTEADRRLVHGDTSGGLELIGVVQRHARFDYHVGDEISRILARSELADDVIAHGLNHPGELDLDVLVDQILVNLDDLNQTN